MARLLANVNLRRFASYSRRHFRGDPRYDLRNVSEGFASRLDLSSDDTGLLERICRAYARAVAHPQSASVCYGPTEWWKEVRQNCLGPVMRALHEGDVAVLRKAYANFFRDRCATGLVGVPYGMVDAYFRGSVRDIYAHSYMGEALCRIDYWNSQTKGRFSLTDLAGPTIGNPFGVVINGTLVRAGSEYQHYCAHEILSWLENGPSVVGEIGGGYGGMAYYLLRDGMLTTYIDFDVPESLALTSYFLLKAFPSASFLLYGERDLTPEALAASKIVLLPLFEMDRLPAGRVDLMFSSHAMSELSDVAMSEYLAIINRITRNYLLYFGDSRAADRVSRLGSRCLRLLEARSSAWSAYKVPKVMEGEYFHQICRN